MEGIYAQMSRAMEGCCELVVKLYRNDTGTVPVNGGRMEASRCSIHQADW